MTMLLLNPLATAFRFDPSRLADLYEETAAINRLTGNDNQAGPMDVRRQLKLIRDEFLEFVEGFDEADHQEVRDGIGDLLFTLFGLLWRAGYDEDRVLNLSWLSFNTMVERVPLDKLNAFEATHEPLKRTISNIFTHLIDSEHLLEIHEGESRHAFTVATSHILAEAIARTLLLAYLLRIDVVSDYQKVVESNWTKFDTDEETAKLGQDAYAKLGVETYLLPYDDGTQTYYVIKSAKDQVDNKPKPKSYPAHKYLKSIHFKEPTFDVNATTIMMVNHLTRHADFQPFAPSYKPKSIQN